jgi:hypothetical protein
MKVLLQITFGSLAPGRISRHVRLKQLHPPIQSACGAEPDATGDFAH